MRKFAKKVLLTCIIALQVIKPITTLYANTINLEYDGSQHSYKKPPITLNIDGDIIETPDMPPVQIDGRTLVPTREVFEPMGASVEWKSAEKKVFINHGDALMILEVNSNKAWIDGETITTDVPAKIINNKQMVPLRFISETLGYGVHWDEDTRDITITGKADNNPSNKPDEKPGNDEPRSKHITKAEKVEIDSNSGMNTTFSINFSDPIDTYDTFNQPGKIVFDVDKTKNLLASSAILPDNNYVKAVRTSQYSKSQTRIVLDLKAATDSDVEVSKDRKKIYIHMKPMEIKNVKSGNNGTGAYISLPGINKSQVDISTHKDPNKIVIDLPMCTVVNKSSVNDVIGGNIQDVAVDEDNKRTRIVLDLIIAGEYKLTNERGGVRVQIDEKKKLETKNMEYESGNKEVVTIKKPAGLSVNAINIKDDYRNKRITLTLPGNYNDHFGQEMLKIGSSNLDNVLVKTNGNTEIIIKENKVREIDIVDDGEYFKLVFMSPREKHDKIVLLDLGHGGKDGGASGNGLVEKNLVLEQGLPLFRLLDQDPNFKVYITREDDSYPANSYRAKLANEVGADLFVSLHNNSFSSPKANGTEVLYSTRCGKCKQTAQIIQKNMIRELGMTDRKTKPRPGLIVLNQTKMPAVLVETGFISNPGDAAKLSSKAFNEKVGRVIYESIIESFNSISFR